VSSAFQGLARVNLSPLPSAGNRLELFDWFRGVAVLSMIWVHSANTFSSGAVRGAEWWTELNFWHGLVAPSFFWISGFLRGFFVRAGRRPGRATVYRLLGVLILGYALRFPLPSLLQGVWGEAAWQAFFQVDVLQTLAVTGLLLVALEHAARAPWQRDVAVLVLLICSVLLVKPAESWQVGWLPLDAWWNRSEGSLFPIFPWLGFGLAGFLCGRGASGPAWKRKITWLAGGAGLVAWLIPEMPWMGESMRFFLQRLGWVCLFAGILAWLIGPCQRHLPWLGTLLAFAGRESLILYVIHLQLIHGVPWPGGTLEANFGNSFGLAAVGVWFFGLATASLLLARLRSFRPWGKLGGLS
jgi:uncharacterized membrane protein